MTSTITRPNETGPTPSKWNSLYLVGSITAITLTIIPIAAVIAYFIWPYAPGVKTTEEIFLMTQQEPFGALMALDFFVLLGGLVSVLLLLPLYTALKSVDEGYALIALCLGLLSVAAIVVGRPIAEIFALGDQYAAATTDVEQGYVLAAGEALIPSFHGTAWMVYGIGMSVSYLISALLMLKGKVFNTSTAYVGIATNVCIGLFLLPLIGPLFMFLGTIIGIVWSIQLAREFYMFSKSGT